MDWNSTLWMAGAAGAITLLSAVMHRRRGLGPWSLPPWDFILLTAAICLLVAAVHLLTLWREG